MAKVELTFSLNISLIHTLNACKKKLKDAKKDVTNNYCALFALVLLTTNLPVKT